MERILVVEDDEGIRDLLQETLPRWGYEPVFAVNGQVGLETFRSQDFSVILTDIRMPVMDGLTMLKAIKEENPRVSIIVITGYPSVDSAVESLEQGADYYLVKPIKLDDLHIKIKKAVEQREIQHSLALSKIVNTILFILIPAWIVAGYFLAKLWE